MGHQGDVGIELLEGDVGLANPDPFQLGTREILAFDRAHIGGNDLDILLTQIFHGHPAHGAETIDDRADGFHAQLQASSAVALPRLGIEDHPRDLAGTYPSKVKAAEAESCVTQERPRLCICKSTGPSLVSKPILPGAFYRLWFRMLRGVPPTIRLTVSDCRGTTGCHCRKLAPFAQLCLTWLHAEVEPAGTVRWSHSFLLCPLLLLSSGTLIRQACGTSQAALHCEDHAHAVVGPGDVGRVPLPWRNVKFRRPMLRKM